MMSEPVHKTSRFYPEKIEEIPISIVRFDNDGPKIESVEFKKLRSHSCIVDIDSLMVQLSLNYSILICNGNNYPENIYDLPFPGCDHYRILLVALHAPKYDGHKNYKFVITIIPKLYFYEFDPIITYEKFIVESYRKILTTNMTWKLKFQSLRRNLNHVLKIE